MYLPDCFPEKYLKILDGDCLKTYLYRLHFGDYNNITTMAEYLNIDSNKLRQCIDELTLHGLWHTHVHKYQHYLHDFDFSHLLDENSHILSHNTRLWFSLKESSEITKISDVELIKYEKLFSELETGSSTLLSIEIICLILYCCEYLFLPESLIKYIVGSYSDLQDINLLESKAELCADFKINNIETLKLFENKYPLYLSAVKEVFQITRPLFEKELKYIFHWLLLDDHPLDLLIYACLITNERLQQLVLPYTDKILLNWKRLGITTMGEIIHYSPIRSMSKLEHFSLEKQVLQIIEKITSTSK